MRNGDVKHLCDNLCFKRFRSNPTTFLSKKLMEQRDTDAGNCTQCRAALVPGKSLTVSEKLFCSLNCSITFNSDADNDVQIVGSSGPSKTAGEKGNGKQTSKCSVCNQTKELRHEMEVGKKKYRMCSDTCATAFRTANKLTAATKCDYCGKAMSSESTTNSVQLDGQTRKFCTPVCMNTFKTANQRIVSCSWCQTKKSNFDMQERIDGQRIQLFCSLNCLSLYRVNLQATSNQKVTCDFCIKFAPAQYHLTMSDASVRNFCTYQCVMGFQAQFQQPQTPSAGRGQSTGTGRGRGTPKPTNQPAGRGRGRPPKQATLRGNAAFDNVCPFCLSFRLIAWILVVIHHLTTQRQRTGCASQSHLMKTRLLPSVVLSVLYNLDSAV